MNISIIASVALLTTLIVFILAVLKVVLNSYKEDKDVLDLVSLPEPNTSVQCSYLIKVLCMDGQVLRNEYTATSIEEAVSLMEEELTYYEVEVKSTSIMRVGRA